MRMPEVIVDHLSHIMSSGSAYDPDKAHAYYLKTRKLTPRKPGAKESSSSGSTRVSSSTKPKSNFKQKVKPPHLTKMQAQAANLKLKLGQLKTLLDSLVAELRDRKASAAEAAKPKSASEKSEIARKSAKYYDKNKAVISAKKKEAAKTAPKTKSVAELEAQIKGVRSKIATMRTQLAAALKK